MGDEHEGGAGHGVDASKLGKHRLAQMGIEIGKRFVEQNEAWPHGKGAGQGNSLTLAARKLVRAARLQPLQADDLKHFRNSFSAFFGGEPGYLQAELDIAFHRHVGPERIGLEDHAEIASFGRQEDIRSGNNRIVEPDFAPVRLFKASNHAQECGLAASRGTEQSEKGTVGNVE